MLRRRLWLVGKFLVLLAFIGVVVVRNLPKEPPLSTLEQHIKERSEGEVRYIVMWRHPWGKEAEGIRDGLQVDNCVFTYDREKLKDASAVVFHYSSLDEENMPWKHYRDHAQRFIFFSIESPSYIRNVEHRDLKDFDGHFINWTMNYRRDSDVYYPYLRYHEEALSVPAQHVERLMAAKSKLALWVVSNCDFSGGSATRMRYVDELIAAGLRVQRYGRCFNNSAEFDAFGIEQHRSFKFYLSFENAVHCRDYITEKFWEHGLHAGRVPVVYGPSRADLEKVAPPHSFIHVEDFANAKALVEYLEHLDKNDAEYRAYFRWLEFPDSATKLRFRALKNSRERALCNKLAIDQKPKSYSSVASFIYTNEFPECLL